MTPDPNVDARRQLAETQAECERLRGINRELVISFNTLNVSGARLDEQLAASREENVALAKELNRTYIDERGVVWTRPTAEAYEKVCVALQAHKNVLAECREANTDIQLQNVALAADNERLRGALEQIKTGNWMVRIHNSHDSSENRLLGPFETPESARGVAEKRARESHDTATSGWVEWSLENDGDQIKEIAEQALAAPLPDAVAELRAMRAFADEIAELYSFDEDPDLLVLKEAYRALRDKRAAGPGSDKS